jgi:hypothetical protein
VARVMTMFVLLVIPVVAIAVILWRRWKQYIRTLVKLDEHILKLKNGQSVPSLKELLS